MQRAKKGISRMPVYTYPQLAQINGTITASQKTDDLISSASSNKKEKKKKKKI